MKREILFRGLTAETKEWVFGDLVQWKSRGICAILPQEGDQWKNPFDFEVLPETVGQFTGLTDDNGVKVFDGDEVDVSINGIHLVEWNDDLCLFQFSDGTPINSGDSYGVSKFVTGNIHDK
jgi:uncharacterized phage protein (TIGR01671 family)